MTIVRPARPDDAPLLAVALSFAADWRSDAAVRPVEVVMAEPALAHYVAGWGSERDAGVVAEDEAASVAERFVGAAWWRFLPGHDRGYGFVDEAIPEVSIGVVPECRGEGVGTALMEALVAEARRRSLPALSLSVETDNPAASLYRRLGFVAVAHDEGADTMVLRLGA